MQKESYRNPEIAKLLNAAFIPVKIDREINTALDSEMQDFSEATRGQAGWPLNVFITPEGHPLFASLYSPPQEFMQLISRLNERWQQDSAGLKQLAQPPPVDGPLKSVSLTPHRAVEKFVEEALDRSDMLQGGFGDKSKFPHSPQLAALLALQSGKKNTQVKEFLTLTLAQMAKLGLRDHVGGGFFRYTTDPDWRTPHFEKMLYDNAQLAKIYFQAARVFARPEYQHIAFNTVDFMLAEMQDKASGAFYSSLSAVDDKNREGGYYLWDASELRQILNRDELALINKLWGMTQPPATELGYLPLQLADLGTGEQTKLAALYNKLKTRRDARNLPKDTKLLTGLNGLALTAFSEAAQLNPRYRVSADRLRDFLNKHLSGETLSKGESAGRPLGPGDLEDYAFVAAGLASYAKLSGKAKDRRAAQNLILNAWKKFYVSGKGWKLDQHSLLASQKVLAAVSDGPTPSAAALLIGLSKEFGPSFAKLASEALNLGTPQAEHNPFWHATLIKAMGQNSR